MTTGEMGIAFAQFKLTPLPIHFRAEAEGQSVADASLERMRLAPGVTRTEVREHGLFASFFLPAGDGPHPAIIIVSGSGGGLSESRGALYAQHGIAALSLAYFAYETLPKGLIEIPLEYFETALDWLQAHPALDPNRIAVTGGSRGGELSLLLGATFPQIKAVVAYVPSHTAWAGFSADGGSAKSSWTFRGEPIPYVLYEDDVPAGPEPIPLTPGFLRALTQKKMVQAAEIPVERINGAVLLISGEEDAMWPSAQMADAVIRRLAAHNFAHPYRHIRYPNAGHMILAGHIPATVTASRHPVDGMVYAYGGDAQGYAHANVNSWASVLAFLAENL